MIYMKTISGFKILETLHTYLRNEMLSQKYDHSLWQR